MKYFILKLILFITFLSGCVKSGINSTIDEIDINNETKYSGIVILAVDREDYKFAECIHKKMVRLCPKLTFIEGERFRKSLYPWFEPSTLPDSIDGFSKLLSNTRVRDRLDDMNADLLIQVYAKTITFDNFSGGQTILIGSQDRETRINTILWDLKNVQHIGGIRIDHKGTAYYGLIHILPYFLPANTESASCRETAERISSWLNNGDNTENKLNVLD